MKKVSAKGKASQASKGCQKISNFFVMKNNQIPCQQSTAQNTTEPIIIDSDEDLITNTFQKKRDTSTKRKYETSNELKVSPPLKKVSDNKISCHSDVSPVPSTSGMTKIEQKSLVHIHGVNGFVQPTLSETPVKNPPLLAVKSAEKLLSPRALIAFNSPDKSTPQKNKIYTKTLSSSSGKSSSEKTPKKLRNTPKKLFEKSPENLNKFNIEVLKNFVRITPSKSNPLLKDDDYSRRSQEIQFENEKTPVKAIIPNQSPVDSKISPALKVRAKLDFSDCSDINNIKKCNTQCNDDNPKRSETNAVKNRNVIFSPKKLSPSEKIEDKENFNLEGIDFDDDSWDAQVLDQIEYTMDLSQSQHCKIVDVTQKPTEVVLTLRSTKTTEQAICSVRGFWIHSKFCVGDTLHITAKKLGDNEWLVDSQDGFIVYEPDLLISTTSVVGSLFCKRKCVFNEKYKGFEGTNKYMLVGGLIHEIMQEVFKRKLRNLTEIEACARSMLASPNLIRRIYESEITPDYLEKEILMYLPKIADFVQTYVEPNINNVNKPRKGNWEGAISAVNGIGEYVVNRELGKKNPKQIKKDDWQGVITAIDDIEENIWSPDLGVKGKIDVSVKSGLVTMPLEVKTGKASCSLEHKAQVSLYIMMMNKFGYRVPSGLLLYIKEGVLKEIKPSHAENRDIMITRNELAYYLKQEPYLIKDGNTKRFSTIEVPEPIDRPSCSKCPYNVLCATYSKYTNEDLSSKSILQSLHSTLLNDLVLINDAHIEYFMHWNGLLHLEMGNRSMRKELRDIYTLPPSERKVKGKCLVDLKLSHIGPESNGVFETTFETESPDITINFLSSGLQENNYVVVSVPDRPAIASGFVTDIQVRKISLSIDRDISKKYSKHTFYLDTYDSTVFMSYNLASLLLILEPSEGGQKLRNVIIDKEPPRFLDKLPKVIAEKGKTILKRLNKVQQRAVLKAIAAEDYMLIKGMPGTGKTATIVALIQLLVEMNKTILITSHTHSAVDNVCLKLVKLGVNLMRLGSEAKIHNNLKEYSEHFLTKDCKSPEELDAVFNGVQVLAVTCFGSGHPVLTKRTVDICIVDESTQVLQCSVLRPLSVARTFILIGDPDQLPAVVQNTDAIEMGMTESLFERLNSDAARITLNLNYRMNEPITALANALTYEGELLIGAEHIAKATLKIPHAKILDSMDKWVSKALDQSLENAAQLVDTGPIWDLKHTVDWMLDDILDDDLLDKQIVNIYEAAVIYRLVHALLRCGVSPFLIGVIATYRSQVNQITKILGNTRVEINTIDQYQGKDKSVILYSCSKSQDMTKECRSKRFELLEDKRRLNVAITRAKHKLIIVGDLLTLQKYTTFSKISPILKNNVIKLPEFGGFSWESLFSQIDC